MTSLSTTKPAADEYAPYYSRYIDLVPSGNIIETLHRQMTDTLTLLSSLSQEQANHRYSPEKWSIKEIIGHIVDSERVFSYRALRFARNDKTPLPGFEQDGNAGRLRIERDAALLDALGHLCGKLRAECRPTQQQPVAQSRAPLDLVRLPLSEPVRLAARMPKLSGRQGRFALDAHTVHGR